MNDLYSRRRLRLPCTKALEAVSGTLPTCALVNCDVRLACALVGVKGSLRFDALMTHSLMSVLTSTPSRDDAIVQTCSLPAAFSTMAMPLPSETVPSGAVGVKVKP